MESKRAMLILGLVAMVFLISSEVSARDLNETSTDTKKGNSYLLHVSLLLLKFILNVNGDASQY
jgi:hypothetical protein